MGSGRAIVRLRGAEEVMGATERCSRRIVMLSILRAILAPFIAALTIACFFYWWWMPDHVEPWNPDEAPPPREPF